ncbi:Rieske (2Fe-2S) protein [Paraburkholderia azotifigens]|uniref:Rieske (2Fe-2S) protein n=1 Tax=Paraburkholderia azotifigens TaxID=2057004 RepID=UPI0038B74331
MSRQVGMGVAGEIEPGQRKRVFVDGRCVVIFNVDGEIYAIDDSCPHNGASLGNGELEGCVLRCPAHGLRFDLRTGRTPGTGGLSLSTFAVATVDSKLVLILDEHDATPANGTGGNAAGQPEAQHCATRQEK